METLMSKNVEFEKSIPEVQNLKTGDWRMIGGISEQLRQCMMCALKLEIQKDVISQISLKLSFLL